MTEDLTVNADIVIPGDELHWTFSTSGGPGGQHANRSNTRAELRFDLPASTSIPDHLRSRMLASIGDRLVGGMIVVVADDSRSQWRNRQIARKRLADLLNEAARPPLRRVVVPNHREPLASADSTRNAGEARPSGCVASLRLIDPADPAFPGRSHRAAGMVIRA